MRYVFLLVIAATLFSGCATSEKYAAYMGSLYKGDHLVTAYDTAISCTLNVPVTFESLVHVDEIRSHVLDGSVPGYHCELHPKVPFTIFRNELYRGPTYASLRSKLSGHRLEIRLTSLPTQFKYTEIADHYSYVMVGMTEYTYKIYPVLTRLAFEYTLYDGNTMLKNGKIVVESNDMPYDAAIKRTRTETRNAATKAFLGQYERNLTQLTEESIEKLVSEL